MNTTGKRRSISLTIPTSRAMPSVQMGRGFAIYAQRPHPPCRS